METRVKSGEEQSDGREKQMRDEDRLTPTRCLHPLVRACIRSSPRAAQVQPGRGATKESGVPPQPGWETDFASAHLGSRVRASFQRSAIRDGPNIQSMK
uniref:Uncharacterized protein n=1 Tax=Oryza meridionalis TaxID=40149 RepID=A0A0E0F478_9ORYZ